MIRAKVQSTLIGRYFTAGGHWYCGLNEVRYSEHYMDGTSQQVDTGIAASKKCVTVNIIWKILHSMWTLVLQLEWSGYSEHYTEGTSQQVDTGIAAWKKWLQWTLYGSVLTLMKTTYNEMCNILTVQIHSGTKRHLFVPLRQGTANVCTWNCAVFWERISTGRLVTVCHPYTV